VDKHKLYGTVSKVLGRFMTLQFLCLGKQRPFCLTVTVAGKGRSNLLYFGVLLFLAVVSETRPKQHETIQKIHILSEKTESQPGKTESNRDLSPITGCQQAGTVLLLTHHLQTKGPSLCVFLKLSHMK